MSLTSAASGENYRNWWPHPTMTAFTDYSIDLMEAIARESRNRIHMTRRGYVLATRQADPAPLLERLDVGYAEEGATRIRVHASGSPKTYRPAERADWETAPRWRRCHSRPGLIRNDFPSFDPAVATLLHIRRAGDISGQQLGAFMLEHVRARGGSLKAARVVAIERGSEFILALEGVTGSKSSGRDRRERCRPLRGRRRRDAGEELPIVNVFQQKIALADPEGAIDRKMPFAIDLDGQIIDWTDEERATLQEDAATRWLTKPMPGAIHCRPEGGEAGQWIKLGWAYNRDAVEAHR